MRTWREDASGRGSVQQTAWDGVDQSVIVLTTPSHGHLPVPRQVFHLTPAHNTRKNNCCQTSQNAYMLAFSNNTSKTNTTEHSKSFISGVRSKHCREVSFEACCQWLLVLLINIVQIATPQFTFTVHTEVHRPFSNYILKENIDSMTLQKWR